MSSTPVRPARLRMASVRGLAGAHFEVDEAELLAEFGVGVVEILGNAHERLVETETGLHTDDGKIQGIRQREADAELAFLDRAF